MSAFEITVTPSRLKQKKRMEAREPTVVMMAPFSAKAIVQFEDVPITKTARRTLRVINPSDEDIEVKVTKAVQAEHNLSLEWMEHTIPAHDEVPMELVWSPQLEVACKETLQLLDNRNFRKDIMIIFKSKGNQPAKNTRKFPSVGKTLQLKSPTGGLKVNKSASAAAVQQKKRLSTASAATKTTSAKPTWRNVPVKRTSTPSVHIQAPLVERNVYREESPFVSPQSGMAGFKENVSPATPRNVLTLIDQLAFTPLEGQPERIPRPDNLAAWPTPTLHLESTTTHTTCTEMRPRRLTPAELGDESYSVTSHSIRNKTFEVGHSETLSISSDTLDCSRSDQLVLKTPAGLNKTTTITQATFTRPLECIHEEEATTAPTSRMQDLKRDVHLVGSPLRKYSESMKDLSLLSCQTKFGVQGSMPNLNEMAQIRSIEQNRYYQQQTKMIEPPKKSVSPSLDNSMTSEMSLMSQHDLLFNQNEILAQSSRFNLNELGKKSHKGSPVKGHKTPTNLAQKRRSHELSFSDIPSTESLHRNQASDTLEISPPKRQRFDAGLDISAIRHAPANASAPRVKAWNQVQPKKFKLAQTLSLMKKPATPRKVKQEPRVRLYDSELYLQTHINPDPFAATTTMDPFLASTMYLDEEAVEKHLEDFKKWLNALVSIPADLDADSNNKIDVGKLFNEVRNKELVVAPTKEEQSMNYLTNFRLESLRRAAVELFFSEEMRLPCSKVAVYVNKQALRIRSDRNLHLDVVMQRSILELLLCFNPLWLRLGLEVVFGEKIHLQSSRDIVGLSTFILNRLFRNKCEEQKFSKAYTLTEEYAETVKKHTLQKMLFLLLFLDKAKQHRIVTHNPCLFAKKSPHKETKDILLRFSSELLANIGDITRELRRLGYVLQHKQSFLDEFNYAFNNLAVDLRDGVRLTRVMEVILLRDDLTRQLRVPAISRLQRIFNVKLALTALSAADFQLKGDIAANDIVDGHREKTLSLLWQIIYKFRSPKFHAAARVLQQWWRKHWLRVVIRRRIAEKERLKHEKAATLIQAVFRGHRDRKFAQLYRLERVQASIVLQKYMRRYLAQKQLFHSYQAIVLIQRWYRAVGQGRVERHNFLQLRESVIFLQRIWRRRIFSRKLLAAAETLRLQQSQLRQAAASCIQLYWQAYRKGKEQRIQYLRERQLVILLQRRWRATRQMRESLSTYRSLRKSTVVVQSHWRAKCLMKKARSEYQEMRKVVVKVQRQWRAKKLMQAERTAFLNLKRATLIVCRRWQATRKMRMAQEEYHKYRRAAIVLQRRYRARLAMKRDRGSYEHLKKSVLSVQRRWRGKLIMQKEREAFLATRNVITQVQRRFRATLAMRKERKKFLQLRRSTISLQIRWRARKTMIKQRLEYERLKQAAVTIQRRFRAHKTMRFLRAKYRGTMTAVLCLQEHWRAHLKMRNKRKEFLQLKKMTVFVQQTFRRKQLMKNEQKSYQTLRQSTILVQQHWRAILAMRRDKKEFILQKQLIIQVQQRWRAQLAMRMAQKDYKKQRQAAIVVQRWYRGLVEMRCQQNKYRSIRSSCLTLQRKWRATLAARKQREVYLKTIERVCLLQRRVRATLAKREQRRKFLLLREAAIVLQRRYRARLDMLRIRVQYQILIRLTVCLQRQFRARQAMRLARNNFLVLKRTTVFLQQKFRGHRQMLVERERFQLLRQSTLQFQARLRGYLARQRFQALMTPEMMDYLRQKKAAKVIQRYWRGYRIRKRQKHLGLLAIRKRIVQLRKESTAMNCVRNKLKESVRFLKGRYVASEALSVLSQLDRLSRTVPHLLMWCAEFMSTFCYGIMAQAIRSEVDKLLIERCSRIILNLARYNCTTANTFQEVGLVTIAQMLLRWCDKDSEIFNTLCTLIWVFAHCPKKRKIIHDFMTTTDAIYMVRETKKLVLRKEKMKQNVRKPINHPQKQSNFSPVALPSLEPDFGIIRFSPYTFVSSVYAFDTILTKLDISLI